MMEVFMKENLKIMKQMDLENYIMQMEITTKACGMGTKHMGWVPTSSQMAVNT